MSHIGKIIKEIRCNRGMSRNKLTENVCTEKYLYLIEKGQRSPSTEILRLFSTYLGTDLFEYYQYLDCVDPIKVCETIKQFDKYRRIADFASLKKLNDTIITLADFQEGHWKYEVEVNIICFMIFLEQKSSEAISRINEVLIQMEPKYSEEEYTANLYVLLSTCYQMQNDIDGATKALSSAKKIVENKKGMTEYNQITVSVKLNIMTLCHLSGDHSKAIEVGLAINNLQLETNSSERGDFTSYYLAYSYYKKEQYEEAFKWFEKCLFHLLIHYRPISAYYISNYDLFYVFFNSKRISPDLVLEIKNKYDCIQA